MNTRIITSEIVLSSDMQAQIYNKIGETGMIAYPCVQVKGQAVDLNTSSRSEEVGCMGARVKESWIVFRCEGDAGITAPSADDATLAKRSEGMKISNQIQILGGATTAANMKWTNGGGKSISLLTKINKLYMELGGQKLPSGDALDNLGTDLQKAYALYSQQFKDDHTILPLEDFVYRYYKLKISYDGAESLFPGLVGEQGLDTSMSQI